MSLIWFADGSLIRSPMPGYRQKAGQASARAQDDQSAAGNQAGCAISRFHLL